MPCMRRGCSWDGGRGSCGPGHSGAAWTLFTVRAILANPRYTGRQVWNRQPTSHKLIDPGNTGLGHRQIQRWAMPDGWVISARPSHPGLVSEEDFIAMQGLRAQRVAGMAERRRYLLAGLLRCGICGRRMESCWAGNRPAYRCRHGYSSAVTPNPARPKNADVREDRILPHLPALHARLAATAPLANQRRRTRAGIEIARPVSAENVTGYLRAREITLSYDPRTALLRADTPDSVTAVITATQANTKGAVRPQPQELRRREAGQRAERPAPAKAGPG